MVERHIMYENERIIVLAEPDGESGSVIYKVKRNNTDVSGHPIGSVYKEVDGYYNWVAPNLVGVWNARLLREVANMLDTLNKEWDEQVRRDLSK